MKLSEIFDRPVDRNIEGVIKADDETSLGVEVEEYVLTNEAAKRIETFLEAYNHYQGANGVWISGFFGSGKSHLLKMLALLLENRAVDGQPVLERFLPKAKNNALLAGALQKAASIPSRSILFNIDQKADVIMKTQVDALLAVFVKVFDEMCGYYGKHGYIAQFERDLDARGQYEDFKRAYAETAGQSWETGREQRLLEGENVAAAFAKINGNTIETARGILDRYRQDYKVSIEDFAEMVGRYVESQGPNFRLNFFVDEVGQYIADNVKLMTNLQTIAESLATRCRGRAWLIVTAQEDMSDILGKMNTHKTNDFTKIADRFKTKMKLTSQNVDEVIQKRLLLKTATGAATLDTLYDQQANNFGTLFGFSDGSVGFQGFRDREHFTHSYPFLPYQFALFQQAIQGLSEHSAFEGRHRSVGERSMLAVFQEVAIHIAGHQIGQLATFDLMYEGIRMALKTQMHQGILLAEKELGRPFAVRVLKALFLVKYVKGFKASVHNVSILVIERFGQDLAALRQDVEAALNLLEQQSYIQRNGELYEFLTNEEKDVEEEIKHTEVDTLAVSDELGKLVFDNILKTNKIRYDKPQQDFAFARKLDDRLLGKPHELAIHIISPFNDNFENETLLLAHAMGRDELLVFLPADPRLMQDLLMYKRTAKYVMQSTSVALEANKRMILQIRSDQNTARYKDMELRLRDLVGRARMFVNGTEQELTTNDAVTRLTQGFYALIRTTYTNLTMLRGITYSEAEIGSIMKPAGAELFPADAALGEADGEIMMFLQSKRQKGERATIKSVVENFERKPYGWSLAAIQCQLAKLAARGRYEARDANLLEGSALERALKNTQEHPKVVLEPVVEYTAGQVRALKDFFSGFFDKTPQKSEARDLARETAAEFAALLERLNTLLKDKSLYPFLAELSAPIGTIKDLTGKPYDFYLTDLAKQHETLLDLKDATIHPIISFMAGPQKTLYDEARRFYTDQQANFEYLQADGPAALRALLAEPRIFANGQMQMLRGRVEALRSEVEARIQSERQAALDTLARLQARLTAEPDFALLTSGQQAQLTLPFEAAAEQIRAQGLIAAMRDRAHRFETESYPRILTQAAQWAHPTPPPGGNDVVIPPPVKVISKNAVVVPFNKAQLITPADVDQYVQLLHQVLLDELAKGHRIQI